MTNRFLYAAKWEIDYLATDMKKTVCVVVCLKELIHLFEYIAHRYSKVLCEHFLFGYQQINIMLIVF